MEKKSLLVAKAPVEIRRAHMKPTTFLKKYGRILIGGTIILAVLFCSIFAPLLTSWDPEAISISEAKQKPGSHTSSARTSTAGTCGAGSFSARAPR